MSRISLARFRRFNKFFKVIRPTFVIKRYYVKSKEYSVGISKSYIFRGEIGEKKLLDNLMLNMS